MKKYTFLMLSAVIVLTASLFAQFDEQDVRKRLDLIHSGKIGQVRTEIASLLQQQPNDPRSPPRAQLRLPSRKRPRTPFQAASTSPTPRLKSVETLQQRELSLTERERLVEERETQLADRERDLAEQEALLAARQRNSTAGKR